MSASGPTRSRTAGSKAANRSVTPSAAQKPPAAAGLLPETPSAISAGPLPLPPVPLPPLALQRKLAIGSSNDPLEAEADRVAQTALETGVRHRASQVGRYCPPPLTEAPPAVHQVLRSPGQELDVQTRDWAEGVFQRDFRQVRVHTGERAEASAAAIHARAYTVGPQIVLGAGASPGSADYRPLLAHELTHVVQQQRSGDRTTIRRQPYSYTAGTDSQGATGSNKPHAGTSAADTAEAQEAEWKRLKEQEERDKFAKEIQGTIERNMQKAVKMLPLELLATGHPALWLFEKSKSVDAAKRQRAATKIPAAYADFGWYLTQQYQSTQIMLAEKKLLDYIAFNFSRTMSWEEFHKKWPDLHPPGLQACNPRGDFADLAKAFIAPEDPRDIFKPGPPVARAQVGRPGPTYEQLQQAQAETLDNLAESPIGALLYYIGLSRDYGTMDMAAFTSAGPVLSGAALGVAGMGQNLVPPDDHDQRPKIIDESKSAPAPARTSPPLEPLETPPSEDLPKTPLDELPSEPEPTRPMKGLPSGAPASLPETPLEELPSAPTATKPMKGLPGGAPRGTGVGKPAEPATRPQVPAKGASGAGRQPSQPPAAGAQDPFEAKVKTALEKIPETSFDEILDARIERKGFNGRNLMDAVGKVDLDLYGKVKTAVESLHNRKIWETVLRRIQAERTRVVQGTSTSRTYRESLAAMPSMEANDRLPRTIELERAGSPSSEAVWNLAEQAHGSTPAMVVEFGDFWAAPGVDAKAPFKQSFYDVNISPDHEHGVSTHMIQDLVITEGFRLAGKTGYTAEKLRNDMDAAGSKLQSSSGKFDRSDLWNFTHDNLESNKQMTAPENVNEIVNSVFPDMR